jgi:hypothetical protein
MNKVNKVIFIGLSGSGLALLPWFIFNFVFEFNIPFLFGLFFTGHYFGLWFGLAAIISFFYGTFMFMIGRMNNYWQSLYPINFGLTLLGVSMWQYNLNMPIIWVLATIISAFAITLIIYKVNATKSRWLLVVLIGVTFITENVTGVRFWDTIMMGIIFICLSIAVRRKERNVNESMSQ